MTYKIEILEKLARTVEINADSHSAALQDAIGFYKDEEIILDSSDHTTTDFDISEDDEEFQKMLNDEEFSDFILKSADKMIVNLSKQEMAKLAFGSLLNAKEAFENSQ